MFLFQNVKTVGGEKPTTTTTTISLDNYYNEYKNKNESGKNVTLVLKGVDGSETRLPNVLVVSVGNKEITDLVGLKVKKDVIEIVSDGKSYIIDFNSQWMWEKKDNASSETGVNVSPFVRKGSTVTFEKEIEPKKSPNQDMTSLNKDPFWDSA